MTGWWLALMGAGLVGAITGAVAYRARQRLAALMLAGVVLLVAGSIGLLATLW